MKTETTGGFGRTVLLARNPLQSLRVRLTLFSVAFLAVALSFFSAYLYRSFVQKQEEAFDTALFNYATDLSEGVQIDFFGSLSIDRSLNLASGKLYPLLAGEAFSQILDRRGNTLARSQRLGELGLPFNKPELLSNPSRRASLETITLRNPSLPRKFWGRYRLVYYPILRGSPNYVILQVAVPTTLLDQQKDRLRDFLWFGIPTTLLVFAVLGFYFSNRALRPLHTIIGRASTMSAAQISERLPVPQYDDELRSLTLTLNGLFERLEKAFQAQDRFVSDASHQLKTPLAILRGELDVLTSKVRPPEETQAFLGSAQQELAHLSRMVDELLILARVDAGRDSLQFTEIRLDDLAVEAVERLQPLAQRAKIPLRFNLYGGEESAGENFAIRGDPDLLKTLIQNLVENAIRYSPEATPVELRLSTENKAVALEVRNFGNPIAPEHISLLFERFSRLPAAQSLNPHGVGLGLSIVKRVAEAHSGRVEVTSTPMNGTVFRVVLPKA